MFLCQPLHEVLATRGIEDIDAFVKVPSWNVLPDPFSIPWHNSDARSHSAPVPLLTRIMTD